MATSTSSFLNKYKAFDDRIRNLCTGFSRRIANDVCGTIDDESFKSIAYITLSYFIPPLSLKSNPDYGCINIMQKWTSLKNGVNTCLKWLPTYKDPSVIQQTLIYYNFKSIKFKSLNKDTQYWFYAQEIGFDDLYLIQCIFNVEKSLLSIRTMGDSRKCDVIAHYLESILTGYTQEWHPFPSTFNLQKLKKQIDKTETELLCFGFLRQLQPILDEHNGYLSCIAIPQLIMYIVSWYYYIPSLDLKQSPYCTPNKYKLLWKRLDTEYTFKIQIVINIEIILENKYESLFDAMIEEENFKIMATGLVGHGKFFIIYFAAQEYETECLHIIGCFIEMETLRMTVIVKGQSERCLKVGEYFEQLVRNKFVNNMDL